MNQSSDQKPCVMTLTFQDDGFTFSMKGDCAKVCDELLGEVTKATAKQDKKGDHEHVRWFG
jgi:hypothetical protein